MNKAQKAIVKRKINDKQMLPRLILQMHIANEPLRLAMTILLHPEEEKRIRGMKRHV